MSPRRVQIVILCEDRQQEVFARHFLEKRGFQGRFRSNICPSGSQSGEQFVRTQYPKEVKAYRQNRNRVSIGLVVFVDADNYLLPERLRQLDKILKDSEQAERQSDEAIAVFVPKRNIETWIHYLQGNTVDEDTAYPKFPTEGECKSAVADLAHRCRERDLLADSPRSLQTGCDELQRLLPLLKS